jgi:peptidoglycan/LPS O-acetylase OafA/YrhL
VSTSTSRPQSVRIGLVLFVLGLVFIAIDVLPFFFDDHNTPLWLNLACLLAPLGFGIAIWSGIAAGRAEQRAAARAVERQS